MASDYDNMLADLSQNRNPQGTEQQLASKMDTFIAGFGALTADRRQWAAGPSTVRQITARVGINTSIGANTNGFFRNWQKSFVPLNAIQIAYANWYLPSATKFETGCGGPCTISMSVEYPLGTFYRITWNGAAKGVIADLTTGYSDLTPLPVTIPAGAWFRINTYVDYSLSGGKLPFWSMNNCCDRANGDQFEAGQGVDRTLNDTNVGGTAVGNITTLAAVMGWSNYPVWGLIGDSICAGWNDLVFNSSGGRGILGKSLAKFVPNLNFGVFGDQATIYTAHSTLRQALMIAAGMTSGIVQLGTNDLDAGRSAVQVAADRVTIKGFFPNIPIYDTTVIPHTSSTDSWQTVANQTVSSSSVNTQRIALNDTLRNTFPSTQKGLIDVSAMIEYGTGNEAAPQIDGGFWKPGTTGDGQHPNWYGHAVFEQEVDNFIQTRI